MLDNLGAWLYPEDFCRLVNIGGETVYLSLHNRNLIVAGSVLGCAKQPIDHHITTV
jgi:hypothetical protein